MKNNKGITLIALVITIIVLLILAGVTIASLTGENGLLSRAGNSKIENLKAEAIEKANSEIQSQLINAKAGLDFDTKAEIQTRLDTGKSEGITFTVAPETITNDTTEITITCTVTNATWNSGNIAKLTKSGNDWVITEAKAK